MLGTGEMTGETSTGILVKSDLVFVSDLFCESGVFLAPEIIDLPAVLLETWLTSRSESVSDVSRALLSSTVALLSSFFFIGDLLVGDVADAAADLLEPPTGSRLPLMMQVKFMVNHIANA